MSARHLTVLGGGPAGLAIGYYAARAGWPVTIYEAGDQTGGNARTLRHGEFLYDTGAHRFHDQDPEITRDVQSLMGESLQRVDAPSQIYYRGRYIDFPLTPLNLVASLGLLTCGRAALELASQKLSGLRPEGNFESLAVARYGPTLARVFLLEYSEKLWGAPCLRLSPAVSGKRMKGLTLKTFLKEVFQGRRAKTEHLDGAFYYPTHGIGMITDALAGACGEGSVRLRSRVTRLFHDGRRVAAIEVNGGDRVPVDRVACTLPLPLAVRLLEPAAPPGVLEAARALRFRHLILAAVLLKKPRVTPNASVYFPEKIFPFTRVYESRNRSPRMAPEGHTSVVAEVPCSEGDRWWSAPEEEVKQAVRGALREAGWFSDGEVLDTVLHRISHAYPILEVGFEEKSAVLQGELERLSNLRCAGRSGVFRYTHLHDLLMAGKELVEEMEAAAPG